MGNIEKTLQTILDKTVDQKKIFGASFSIQKGNKIWNCASGDLEIDQQFFIASTTKLFTTAIILHLESTGKLSLKNTLKQYFDEDLLKGLHEFEGKDYSDLITIEQLLAHTSGLPDYFQDKGEHKESLETILKSGADQRWTFEDCISKTKKIKPLFIPDAKNKAHYSDTNFQLLGKIIEILTGKTYSENCKEIIYEPLQLEKSYVYSDISDEKPASLYFKSSTLKIPNAMISFWADGGIVSTAAELLHFIRAFFSGAFFPKERIEQLQQWNRIFFPMKSGIGIHLFKLPWIFNPFGAVPYFLGHSGLSGALAFYCPEHEIFISGTVNQIAYPDCSFKTMIKLTRAIVKSEA